MSGALILAVIAVFGTVALVVGALGTYLITEAGP
jgi:hypothetical protein